jgi:hypothetical protein
VNGVWKDRYILVLGDKVNIYVGNSALSEYADSLPPSK